MAIRRGVLVFYRSFLWEILLFVAYFDLNAKLNRIHVNNFMMNESNFLVMRRNYGMPF